MEYEQIAGVKPATAKRQITDLVKKRILAKKGSGTVFWYEIVKDNP
jgi:Fic family protein